MRAAAILTASFIALAGCASPEPVSPSLLAEPQATAPQGAPAPDGASSAGSPAAEERPGEAGETSPEPSPEGAVDVPPAPAVLTWDLLGCDYHYLRAVVPASRLAPYMPAGFRTPGVRDAPEWAAVVGVEVNVCESGLGLDGKRLAPMVYAGFWTPAVPPEDLAFREGDGTFVNWDVLVPDEARRAFLAERGVPARNGTVALVEGPLPGASGVVEYSLDGLGAVKLEWAALDASPPGGGGGGVTHWIPAADGGLSAWEYTWDASTLRTGPGRVTVEAGTWLADVFGGTTLDGVVAVGRWDYTDGKVTFLPPPG